MRKSVLTLAAMAALGALATISMANAQQIAPFDAKKFFDEVASRGIKMPAGFDGNKFFDEIASRGSSGGKTFDGKAFFDELANRGVKMPAGFDGNKFFDEIASRGIGMPPMVYVNRKP